MTDSTMLSAAALVVMLVGATPFLYRTARVRVRANPLDILLPLYAGLSLSLVALGMAAFTGEPLGPVLAWAAVPLVLAPALLFVMHRRRIPPTELKMREGECLPRFQATRHDGTPFDVAELRGSRVLLKFYRGYWCPFCSAELRQFDAMRPQLEARGIRIFALSKDTVENAAFHRERDGLGFTLLSDPDLAVIRQLGLEHEKALEISGSSRFHILGFPIGTRPKFESMAVPTTVLLDEHGRIRHIDQSTDYQVRADAERVRAAVDAAFGPASLDASGALPALPASPDVVPAPCW